MSHREDAFSFLHFNFPHDKFMLTTSKCTFTYMVSNEQFSKINEKKIHQNHFQWNDVNDKNAVASIFNFHSLNKDYVLFATEAAVLARNSYGIWQIRTVGKCETEPSIIPNMKPLFAVGGTHNLRLNSTDNFGHYCWGDWGALLKIYTYVIASK